MADARRPVRSSRYTPPAAVSSRRTPVARLTPGGSTAAARPSRHPAPADARRAPIVRRLVAALVDLTLVPVVVLAGAEVAWRSGLLALLGVGAGAWAAWSWSFGPVAWTVAAAALAYHAGCTARWGGTPGKRLVGLRVEARDGGRVGPWRALWRGTWGAALFLPSVLAPVLAVVGGVAVAAGARRSPADRAAGTRVVLAGR